CAKASAAMSSRRQEAEMVVQAEPAPPCTLVIFGATGDLTRRLLIPSLYNLVDAGLLPDRFAVLGLGRADKDADAFRRDLADSLRQFAKTDLDTDKCRWLTERTYYLRGDFADPDTYDRLGRSL